MAERQTSLLLLETPVVRAYDGACREPGSGYGAPISTTSSISRLPRRGVFYLERQGERTPVHTGTAIMLGPGDEYRVGHPTDEGDDDTLSRVREHGDEIWLEGRAPDDSLIRWTFSEFTEERVLWQGFASYDDGRTWVREEEIILRRRA